MRPFIVDAPCYPRAIEVNEMHLDAAGGWMASFLEGRMSKDAAIISLARGFAVAEELVAIKPFVKLEETHE